VPALYDPTRHERPGGREWDAGWARDAIAEICRDVEAAFDPRALWPLHPNDYEPGGPEDGIFRGLYLGAAGVVHSLHRLALAGLYSPALDLAAIMDGLLEDAMVSADEAGAGASLLVGSTGILLVAHRLTGSNTAADDLAQAIASNAEHPSNELLLGSPGTMLAARVMHARTGEERFAELWQAGARILLDRQDGDGLWTQDLYGERLRFAGAGHGFASNASILLGAPEWLDDAPEVEARTLATAQALAITAEGIANWPVLVGGSSPSDALPRVQWCHGGPGVIISLAGLGREEEQHGQLLDAAGEFVWQVGPMAANAGLCHGTSGNGFAFLSLLERTGDELWLQRARSFAMHGLDQVTRWRESQGRGRYSLFTGDLGPALLAAACLEGHAGFPGLDDL
jgi:hypothetical protein